MLYIIHWTIATENRNAAMVRFNQTGGAPPAGLKILGRWHAVGSSQGFGVVEADNVNLVFQMVLEWSDLMNVQVFPAVTDEHLAPLLKAAVNRMSV
ncbi:DUF3303 domain-containing protein [Pseudomonas sp. NPDC090755]|uniref:DUF3303 domain-containing protein n=1 Tax=Pseudomonas sp. NPDC090755 TaxID=3364481 RepID=UPI00383B3472